MAKSRGYNTVKRERIRPLTPLSLEDARRVVADFVNECNAVRLHSGIGYVTPQARLEGRDQQILAERRRKPVAARQARETVHQQPCQSPTKLQIPVSKYGAITNTNRLGLCNGAQAQPSS